MTNTTKAKLLTLALDSIKNKYDYPCGFHTRTNGYALSTPKGITMFNTFDELCESAIAMEQFFSLKMQDNQGLKIKFRR